LAATLGKNRRLIYRDDGFKPAHTGEQFDTTIKNFIKTQAMKKIILSLATVLLMGISAFAGKNDEVNQLAVNSFHKEFVSARNIVWEQKETFLKVTFTLNDQVLFAYYNNNGDRQAVVRNLISSQLPINLMTDLKKEYSGFWISDLFEIATDDQTSYYITLENADKKIVLKSNGAEGWNVYAKSRKNVE
jgi:hypothetical protein